MGFRFELDYFKKKFDPLLEADMPSVRVKVLEFTYPETEGRRRVRLDTNASDDKFAILELLQNHMWKDGLLQKLHVTHAELQVKVNIKGKPKSCFIKLWPNRCSLNQTPLAEKLRDCLQKWGIYHAPRP